jgi:hypothetical protein
MCRSLGGGGDGWPCLEVLEIIRACLSGRKEVEYLPEPDQAKI